MLVGFKTSVMNISFIEQYFYHDGWVSAVIAIAALGVFWVYHRYAFIRLQRQQKEIEENEFWLNEAQQLGNIGSWYRYIASGKCRWSKHLKRMFEVDDDVVPTFDLFCEHVHPEDRDRVVAAIRQVETSGKSIVLHLRTVKKDGSIAYLENQVNGAVDHCKRVIATYGSVRDITEQNAKDNELRNALREAESAHKAKMVFLSMVSHEIRTPLNAIIGFSRLIFEQQLTAEQLKRYGQSINAAGQTLSALVNDVLDISALKSSSFTLAPVKSDIRYLVEDVLMVFNISASAKGIALSSKIVADLPQVLIDGARLRQVLINIIGNALKYTTQGYVKIEVRAEAEPEHDVLRELIFEVADSGIGIDPADHQRIFEDFEQVHADINRKASGSGLGLSIVKQLVEKMNGEVKVSSQPGSGAIFTITFYNVQIVRSAHDVRLEADSVSGSQTGLFKQDASPSVSRPYDELILDYSMRPEALTPQALKAIRAAFYERFAVLAKGVNLSYAKQLSTDLNNWSQSQADASLVDFADHFSRCLTLLDVGQLLKISALICD